MGRAPGVETSADVRAAPHGITDEQGAERGEPLRVLIVFNTIVLYGMELSVIESFDCLRPELQPMFLLPKATERYGSAVLKEIQRRGLKYTFFSDRFGWPRIGRPRSWSQVWQIPYALVRGNIDVLRATRGRTTIYIPIRTALLFSVLAIIRARLKGNRVIYSFHDLPDRSLTMRLVRPILNLSTHIVHMTGWSRAQTIRVCPYLASTHNLVIAPLALVQSRVDNKQRLLQDYSSRRNIVFIGQVSKRKGIDMLLETFQILADRFDDVYLHIVGGTDWEYEGDFAAAITKTGVADRIHAWGYCADVRQFLEIACIYVQPSVPSLFHESFGRGIVEAMSVAVPGVAFQSGALVEIIEHDVTGLLCDEETAECLAAAIGRLLDDPALRDRLGRNAREKFERLYSRESIREQWLKLLAHSSGN